MPTLLTDADIATRLGPDLAIAWMRDALLAQHTGRLATPPRLNADLEPGRLIFTTGALDGEWFGYRSYDTFDAIPGQQVVVVHDWLTGTVRGIAVGNEIGPRRVGAIGAVAADLLARPEARTLGMLGAGIQAWAQLWALRRVRTLVDVTVFSRDAKRRTCFAARATEELGIPVRAAASAEEAVRERDMVVLATNSGVPVVDEGWVSEGAYVTTLGPKQVGRSEFGPELAARADLVVTDSVAQIRAYEPPYILLGTRHERRMVGLSAIVSGERPGRTDPGQTILFCSVGLAGAEAYLLARLLETT